MYAEQAHHGIHGGGERRETWEVPCLLEFVNDQDARSFGLLLERLACELRSTEGLCAPGATSATSRPPGLPVEAAARASGYPAPPEEEPLGLQNLVNALASRSVSLPRPS
eukprot:TRINITY_DN7395_c0_g1_i3.p3 TRINITY_DN7395_c0_g1~~TRINITY_DN7395_c0_g1_i3.p3  ORF type:complete len:110 (-),score=17.58 TRINITY_DN7395_c0_g1_i3:198-527(-)